MSDPNETPQFVVRIQERAVRDINAAHVRLAELTSRENANLWRTGLTDAIKKLATMPRRFPIAPEPFADEVRQLVYRREGNRTAHRVLFTVTDQPTDTVPTPTVIILHVRHAAARPLTRRQAREIMG